MTFTVTVRRNPLFQVRMLPRVLPLDGEAATIEIGTVTTLAAGADATVVNSGTENAAVLDFGLPRGATGIVESVVAGSNVSVDATDPANPIVSSVGGSAATVTFAPAGNIAATNVQAAIQELDTEKQPIDTGLTALAAFNTNGIIVQTANDTFAGRSVAVTASTGLSVTNGNGVSGNPTLAGIDASTTVKGVVELATNAETQTGTDTVRAVTPAGLRSATRELLTANRTYYVRTDGSNSNTGLVDSAGGAFLTLQKAADVVYGMLDLGGFDVTIQVRTGTYTGAISIASPQVGAGNITFNGDTTTPSNVFLNVANSVFTVSGYGSKVRIQGFKLASSSGWAAINADAGGFVNITGKMEYGTAANYHISATAGALIFMASAEEVISGGAVYHYSAASGGYIQSLFPTFTLSGTPAFTAFANAESAASLLIAAIAGTTGSATGKRYNCVSAGSIAGGQTLPGSTAGTCATGGVFS